MSPARKRLKEAAATVATITAQIRQLETAATSSARIVEQATAQLEGFKGLDKEVTKFRVDAVKSGLGTQSLPDSLKTKLASRRAAEEELEQAEETRQMIDGELKAAQETLRPAEEAKTLAAVAVLQEIADIAAAELTSINARQWELAWVLRGLEFLSFSTSKGIRQVGQTPMMVRASVRVNPEFVGVFDPTLDMASRWKNRLDILLADPDADLSLPKPVTPQDYEYTLIAPHMTHSRVSLRPEV